MLSLPGVLVFFGGVYLTLILNEPFRRIVLDVSKSYLVQFWFIVIVPNSIYRSISITNDDPCRWHSCADIVLACVDRHYCHFL